MARYIKANKKVAAFLNLTRDRNTVSDGNYLLWQADMLAFGKLTELPTTLRLIGGIALMAHEAKEEQDGTVCRQLPVAEDPRFIIEEEPKVEGEQDGPAVEKPDENTADGDNVAADGGPTTTEKTEKPVEEPKKETAETKAEKSKTATKKEVL